MASSKGIENKTYLIDLIFVKRFLQRPNYVSSFAHERQSRDQCHSRNVDVSHTSMANGDIETIQNILWVKLDVFRCVSQGQCVESKFHTTNDSLVVEQAQRSSRFLVFVAFPIVDRHLEAAIGGRQATC